MNEAAQPRKLNLNDGSTRSALTGKAGAKNTSQPMTPKATTPQTKTLPVDNTDAVLDSVYNSNSTNRTAASSRRAVELDPTVPPKKRKSIFSRLWFRVLMVVLLLLVIVGAAGAAVGFYTYTVAMELKVKADETEVLARGAYDQFKTQNLPGAQAGFEGVKSKLQEVRATYQKLSFYNAIPFARAYYQDGIHGLNAADAGVEAGLKSLSAVTPYADVLGFAGEGTFTGGTAEDRLKLILQTLSKITPQLDAIGSDLNIVKDEFAQIDANRYPENFQGRPIRSYVVQAQNLSAGAATALTEFRPVIERIPDAAGAEKRRKYLVLFQNDNELRPTGGFLTAYSVIFVENGKVTPEKSDDIYELDKKFAKKLPIPPILGKYLTTETKWNMRDMNISPDFKESMDQFLANYKNIPGEPKDIDGIIAVDTQVLTDMLRVLGPVEVPGYGTFSAENDPQCDCPQIIYALSQIITRPTPYIREDRKGILGPMMGALLQKAYTAPKTQWPQLLEVAWKDVQGRHAQFYFFDETNQAAAEKINAAGRLTKDANAEDFLAIINANLGGAKSNLFITYEVNQEVSAPEGGNINKKVEITYKNSRRADNCNLEAGLLCLNSRLRDWTRLYVPKGSQLKSSQGFREGSVKTSDEGDFTVIEGEFFLDPLSQAKLQLEYTVPYTNQSEYKVKLWKQGGISPVPVNFDVNGSEETVTMDKDLTFTTAF
jgi:hypothetical protein